MTSEYDALIAATPDAVLAARDPAANDAIHRAWIARPWPVRFWVCLWGVGLAEAWPEIPLRRRPSPPTRTEAQEGTES